VGRARPATQANGDPSPTAIVSDLTLACDQRAVRPNMAAAFMERAVELLADRAGTGS